MSNATRLPVLNKSPTSLVSWSSQNNPQHATKTEDDRINVDLNDDLEMVRVVILVFFGLTNSIPSLFYLQMENVFHSAPINFLLKDTRSLNKSSCSFNGSVSLLS